MSIHWIINKLIRGFRRKRMALFGALAKGCRRVVDLGGTAYNWQFATGFEVTLINVRDSTASDMEFIRADATCCPFSDNSFDIVFSNSLIEHVGDWEAQKRLALEIRRLAPRYFVQTPNKWFPIEPHVLAPFVQFVPRRLRPWVIRWFTPVGLLRDRGQIPAHSDVRMLSRSEMQQLFPDARIITERFLGMTKSLIAVRI